jgi:hypothetical protein
MDVPAALKAQYHAALSALRQTIDKCPEAMWNDPADGPAPFWRVAYHALFFTHLYLQRDPLAFTPWARAREEAQFLAGVPWDNYRPPKPCQPYTRSDILEYWGLCDGMIDAGVEALDLSAAECGFPWYTMPKLEHQINSIRHLQHHAAALSVRLRRGAGIDIHWVGRA